MRKLVLLAAVAAAALAGCIPVRLSTRCQQLASDCLAQCPDTQMPIRNDRVMGTGFDNDNRNACQKSCHDSAQSCQMQ